MGNPGCNELAHNAQFNRQVEVLATLVVSAVPVLQNKQVFYPLGLLY